MHARVLPSIILMDRQIDQKTPPGVLEIAVLHLAEDRINAERFAALLEQTHPNGVGSYKVSARALSYAELKTAPAAAGYYLLPADQASITRAIDAAIAQSRVSFAYEESLVRSGVLASLSVGRKTTPYLNTDTIAKSRILFNPTLIGIAKRFPE